MVRTSVVVELDGDDVFPVWWKWAARMDRAGATEAQRREVQALAEGLVQTEYGGETRYRLVWMEGGEAQIEAAVKAIEEARR